MAQLALDLHLRDDYRFDSYLTGCNQQLVAAMTDLNRDIPLYVWGENGCGKTHLIHALLKQQVAQGQTVALLSLRDRHDLEPEICEGLERCRSICIDDVEMVTKAPQWQKAIFHLFNRARSSGTQLLVSAHCAPQYLDVFPDLRSRFASCLIFEQHGLNDEDKIQALQKRAAMRGLKLADDVAKFLITRSQRDTHSLFGLLEKLDQYSLAAQRRLTVPLVKEVLLTSGR